MELTSKVAKIDSKIIRSLPSSESAKLTVILSMAQPIKTVTSDFLKNFLSYFSFSFSDHREHNTNINQIDPLSSVFFKRA